jgi:hypothetical protein
MRNMQKERIDGFRGYMVRTVLDGCPLRVSREDQRGLSDLPRLLRPARGVTDHFKTSQSGSNQNQPL